MFGNIQQSGHEELAGAAPHAVNVIVDAAGSVHRRPAITQRDDRDPSTLPGESWTDMVSAEGPIVALHSTAQGRVFAIDAPNPASRIYELAGHHVHNLSVASEGQTYGQRPIIAETEAMLAIAAGGPPMKVLLGTPATVSPLAGAPRATHIIAHSGRLLANNLDSLNMIRYSATAYGSSIAGHEDWGSDNAGFFNADARPDPVEALHESTNEVFGFGTTNLQIFIATDDPANRFAAANAREFGCSAPYSVVKYDQSFGYVDQYRRIMLTDRRDFRCISQTSNRPLTSSTERRVGYRVTLGPWTRSAGARHRWSDVCLSGAEQELVALAVVEPRHRELQSLAGAVRDAGPRDRRDARGLRRARWD